MTEQVASKKLSLLLKIQIQNTQMLQLFTKTIKTENIYKSYLKCQAEGLGLETKWSNLNGQESVSALMR